MQNQSEQLIYQTEKNLDEYKEKLDDSEKKSPENFNIINYNICRDFDLFF